MTSPGYGAPSWLIGAALAFIACDSRRAGPALASADAGTERIVAPSLALSDLTHAFGRVLQGTALHTTVTVTNVGSEPAHLTTALSGQWCVGRLAHDSLAAGESAGVDVTCMTDRHRGPLRETVIVRSGPASSQEVGFEVQAWVEPLLGLDTELLALETRFGEQRTEDVHLVGPRARDARLVVHPVPDADLAVTLSRPAPDAPMVVRVLARGNTVGVHVGSVVIGTDVPGAEELTLPYTHKVTGTLTVAPTNPYLNLRDRGPKTRTITVQSSQPGFRVTQASIVEGPFTASVEQGSDGSARVRVTVLEARLEDETRGAVGRLVIHSNDRSEPRKEIPLLAFGTYHRASGDLERDP